MQNKRGQIKEYSAHIREKGDRNIQRTEKGKFAAVPEDNIESESTQESVNYETTIFHKDA